MPLALNDMYTAQDVVKREFAPAFSELEAAIARQVDDSARKVVETSGQATETARATVTMIVGLVAAGSALLLLLSLLVIRRSVTGPLLRVDRYHAASGWRHPFGAGGRDCPPR